MLVIVMHNNQNYLELLTQLAKKQGVKNCTILKKDGIGIRLIGSDVDLIFSRGKMVEAYRKAFIAVIRDEKKVKPFLELIEDDKYLEMSNLKDKGFICTVPLNHIKFLESESTKSEEV